MRAVALTLALLLTGTASGAECGAIVGWVGVPLCEIVAQVEVPDVVGEANTTAADAALEGVGLDAGDLTARCSDAPADEVVGQAPEGGATVPLGSLIDLWFSTGDPCEASSGQGMHIRIGIGL